MQIRKGERVLLIIGFAVLGIWGAFRFYAAISSKAAVARFETGDARGSSDTVSRSPDPALGSPVDFRLWSPKRIAAYQDSLAKKTDAPLAVLRIAKISLEVPVFNGTDDVTLNRGVGRILGTGQIGNAGNLGIAGHRDGFFRGLQDIVRGDLVELHLPGHTERYSVRTIRIVTPEDTYVLDPTPVPTLTLVTCFPFYFVGHAAKRYIVTAPLEGSNFSSLSADQESISESKNTSSKEKKR